jgi:hypothetical protein
LKENKAVNKSKTSFKMGIKSTKIIDDTKLTRKEIKKYSKMTKYKLNKKEIISLHSDFMVSLSFTSLIRVYNHNIFFCVSE